MSTTKAGDTFFKLVPESSVRGPSPSTPFFIDRAQLDEVLNGSRIDIGASFGLPNKTSASSFKVFEVTVKNGKTPLIFRSTIAPVVENGTFKAGGKTQTLLPQRGAFTNPVPVPNTDGTLLIIRSR